MALLVPDVGEVELLDKMLKDALSTDETLTFRLFTNDFTPVEGSVLTDFTEAIFAGYAASVLTRASWPAAATAAGVTSTTNAVQGNTKTDAGSVTVFGYTVEGTTSTVLLWAERFAASRTLNQNDTLNVTPRVELD